MLPEVGAGEGGKDPPPPQKGPVQHRTGWPLNLGGPTHPPSSPWSVTVTSERCREFQGGHVCDWMRQRRYVSDLPPSTHPHQSPAPSRDMVRPLAPYWVHLEVTPIIFDVDLGYATSWLLIHLHRLDAVLHQEETPNQALLGEGNSAGCWASGLAGCCTE